MIGFSKISGYESRKAIDNVLFEINFIIINNNETKSSVVSVFQYQIV